MDVTPIVLAREAPFGIGQAYFHANTGRQVRRR